MNRYDPRSTRTPSTLEQDPYRDPPYGTTEPDRNSSQEAAMSLASMASMGSGLFAGRRDRRA